MAYGAAYTPYFRCGHKSQLLHAQQYLSGLFYESKRNIERMQERLPESDYQGLQHFISDSPWDAVAVMGEVARQTQASLEAVVGQKGLLLDESGWEKSGTQSVGVARQYIGNVGKVSNAQVGVFAVLVRGNEAGLVNARLYLPAEWTNSPARCARAGIPADQQGYRSKPALAVELLGELQAQQVAAPDWVGGDAIYGNAPELRAWLVAQQQAFVLDIGSQLQLYCCDPAPAVPPPSGGRPPRRAVSAQVPQAVKDLAQEPALAWQTLTYRVGSQQPLRRQAVLVPIWLWSAKKDGPPQPLWLLLSRQLDGSALKQSLCYAPGPAHAPLELATALYRQMQRYWIERTFQDAKQQLGLHEYQVRGWRGWHHHVALTMMALHFILHTRLRERQTIPLLSVPDIRLFLAQTLPNQLHDPEQLWRAMERRHRARQRDHRRDPTKT